MNALAEIRNNLELIEYLAQKSNTQFKNYILGKFYQTVCSIILKSKLIFVFIVWFFSN